MIEVDGHYTYSNMITVRNVRESSVVLYPSPDFMRVGAEMQAFPGKASLYDSHGNEVRSQWLKDEADLLLLSGLKQGLYVVRFKDRIIGKRVIGK